MSNEFCISSIKDLDKYTPAELKEIIWKLTGDYDDVVIELEEYDGHMESMKKYASDLRAGYIKEIRGVKEQLDLRTRELAVASASPREQQEELLSDTIAILQKCVRDFEDSRERVAGQLEYCTTIAMAKDDLINWLMVRYAKLSKKKRKSIQSRINELNVYISEVYSNFEKLREARRKREDTLLIRSTTGTKLKEELKELKDERHEHQAKRRAVSSIAHRTTRQAKKKRRKSTQDVKASRRLLQKLSTEMVLELKDFTDTIKKLPMRHRRLLAVKDLIKRV